MKLDEKMERQRQEMGEKQREMMRGFITNITDYILTLGCQCGRECPPLKAEDIAHVKAKMTDAMTDERASLMFGIFLSLLKVDIAVVREVDGALMDALDAQKFKSVLGALFGGITPDEMDEMIGGMMAPINRHS